MCCLRKGALCHHHTSITQPVLVSSTRFTSRFNKEWLLSPLLNPSEYNQAEKKQPKPEGFLFKPGYFLALSHFSCLTEAFYYHRWLKEGCRNVWPKGREGKMWLKPEGTDPRLPGALRHWSEQSWGFPLRTQVACISFTVYLAEMVHIEIFNYYFFL